MSLTVALLALQLVACRDDPEDTGLDHTCSDELDQAYAGAGGDAPEWGSIVACDDPLDAVAYQEVGEAWGLQGNPDPDVEHISGGVLAVDDVDQDGDLDVIIGYLTSSPVLYLRDGDGFTATTIETVDGVAVGNQPISLADLDGDGLRDLVIAGPPAMLAYNQGGSFLGELLEIQDSPPLTELVPGDLDGDGDVDLYGLASASAEGDQRDLLLLQQDDGSWERVDLEGEVATGMGFDAVLFDRDRDGDLDVYVVNDMGADFGGNVLWENQGGTLTDASEACGCDAVMSGMGVDVGDHDGDGQPDLYLSATGRNLLYQADGDWLYADVGQSTGADPFEDPDEMSWGAVFLDYDNDGLPDILVAQGDQWHGEDPIGVVGDLPIALLGQTPGGTYEHRAAELGMDLQGSWRAVVAVDHNGDGVLDPLVTDVTEQPRLFLSTGCTRNGWLEVEAPPMARVEICAGGARQVAWATTESSWGGARPPVVHFGLGDADRVDRLAIELLDGTVTYVDEPFEARRSVRVVP